MGNLKKWFVPEVTKKEVFEGLYPVVITAAKVFTKEVEKDDKTFNREICSVTFKTLQNVHFPDKTEEKIVVEQNYYFDVPMHINALNGMARAFGINELDDTSQLEGKTGLIGIVNREYQTNDGETRKIAQFGYGLFSYAKLAQNATIEYIANEIQGKPTDEQYKEWFKNHLANYKVPR